MLLQYTEWQSASKNKNKIQREESVEIEDIKRQGSRKKDKEKWITKTEGIREDQQKYVAEVENEVKKFRGKIFFLDEKKEKQTT